MSIESEKDVWPIHASYQRPGIRVGEDGKSYATDDVVTLSKCEIELTEFDDVWLPKKVTYTAGEHVVDISIIWKSINPVPEKLVMTDERLMQLVEKPMRQ